MYRFSSIVLVLVVLIGALVNVVVDGVAMWLLLTAIAVAATGVVVAMAESVLTKDLVGGRLEDGQDL